MTLTLDPLDNTAKVIQAAPIGICVTDAEGRFEMVNPAYCELYGYTEQELLGQPFTLVVPEDNRQRLADLHARFIAGDSEQETPHEWEVTGKEGETRNILAAAARIKDAHGQVKKVTYVIDISERKALEQRLAFLARHDELTGLLNRRAGLELLDEEMQRSRRYATPLCVATCDLDHFKRINDAHGHAVGDSVLREIAALMKASMREHDHVIRLGGEEFLILLPGVGRESAHRAIDRLRQRLESTPVGDARLSLTFSAGVAQFEGSEEPDALMERSDRALYRAKQEGRNRVGCAD